MRQLTVTALLGCLVMSGISLSQTAADPKLSYGLAACSFHAPSSAGRCPSTVVNKVGEARVTPKVIGGSPAPKGLYPWVVALEHPAYGGGGNQYCAGAILDGGEWVITAAHCPVQKGDFAIVGRQDLDSQDGFPGTVQEIHIPHRGQYTYDPDTFDFDVALLKLRKAAPGPYISLAADPTLETRGGVSFTLVGWGTTSYLGSPATLLQYAEVFSYDAATCSSLYSAVPMTLSPSMFCAIGKVLLTPQPAGTSVDACQGDSGGPLLYAESPTTSSVAGVVSWGVGCGKQSFPTVYTKACAVAPWICEEAGLYCSVCPPPKASKG
jgi:secreted trypsin-like serine protease